MKGFLLDARGDVSYEQAAAQTDARPLAQLPALARLADAQAYRVHDLRQIGPDVRIMLRSGG